MLQRIGCFLLSCYLFTLAAAVQAGDQGIQAPLSPEVLIESGQFQVTRTELLLYLELLAMDAGTTIESLSSQRVAQAVIELYGLKTLDSDANKVALYSPAMEAWLPEYLFLTHKVTRYTNMAVDKAMAETDWESEALNFYLINVDEFLVPESVSVRTLLLRTSERSTEDALSIANSILSDQLPAASFESLVQQYSEDEVGRASGGLMENVLRGQTVPPFEQAAFQLAEPGQLSPPVVSEFGVHLIELVSKTAARQKTFEEASAEIIPYLQQLRKGEYRAAIQSEARSREAAGYSINEPAIDAFMASLGHEKMGAKLPRPN